MHDSDNLDEFGSALTRKVLIAMLLGIVIGIALYYGQQLIDHFNLAFADTLMRFFLDGVVDVVGKIFVASLKVLVVPLVFVSLICGVAELKDASSLGRLSAKTLALYLLTTAAAITTALLLALIINPGVGAELVSSETFVSKSSPGLKQVILDIFPVNIVDAMASGSMLQIIVFAILFGIALNRSGAIGKPVNDFFVALNAVIMKFVLLMMELAPYGIFCLMIAMFAVTGPEHILKLAKYFITVVCALLLHGLGFYSLLLKALTGLSPKILLKKMSAVWLFAFSTASSSATIPITLRAVQTRLGVDSKVAVFTVPLGATINMDGTAIMQGVATVFIAQSYGIDIGLSGYLMVILTATLASIGTAGVPGVGMITLALVLEQVGLPVEGIALIIGIDRLLDMLRTAVNVTGDAVVSTIVAKSSGELNEAVYKDESL